MAKICFYHGDDMDGICSAAIIKHRHPDTALIPVSNGMPVDLSAVNSNDNVYVVDYTLPLDDMVSLNNRCTLIWIDHHKTSIDTYTGYIKNNKYKKIEGLRSLESAACELTWQYFFPDTSIPYPVWLIGRFDIWAHHESHSIVPFYYGMTLNYHKPESQLWWNKFFEESRDSDLIQGIINDGKIILKYRDSINKGLVDVQAFESELLGHKCICINRALCGSSVFDSIKNIEKYDIMVVFFICKNGVWNVSLYTTGNVDVGEIAKQFGGGGHAGAAGFKCSLLPFDIVN